MLCISFFISFVRMYAIERYIFTAQDISTYLPPRSTFLSQGNCPARRGKTPDSLSLRKREKKRVKAYWGRNGDERREDVHSSKEQSYITAREKRPSTGRLISKALPPAPFTASLNPRALHEFRHSEPNPSHHSLYLFRLTTARHDDEKRRRVQSSL